MNRQEVLSDYKKPEDKLLLSQIADKIGFVEKRNKIEHTNFLDMYQIELVHSFLNKAKINNYVLWGGYESAERQVLILYPDKLTKDMVEKNYDKIFKIVRVNLAESQKGTLLHKNYLGGIIKLGVKREKIGDIVVKDDGADIIVVEDISKFLVQELPSLTRFKESNIEETSILNIRKNEVKIEEIKIIVPSLRLDNFVSDLAKTSRTKAVEIINNERVFINGQCQLKTSKEIKMGDTLTIRGKGRFVVKEFVGNTRSGRYVVLIEKYV